MASILSLFRRQPRSLRKSTRRRSFLERLEDRLTPTANLLSMSDAYVNEGNTGTASAVFTVTLDQASALPVTVDYFTYSGDADAWVDYESAWGTLTIGPGQTSGTISVTVLGDTEVESDEWFDVVLDNPTGATLAQDYWGEGTIGNDDSATPNDPPIAVDDTFEVAEDYILTSYSLGVLANDFDPELGSLQAILVNGPAHGTLGLDSSGSFYYIPDANYFGTDSFTYRAKDDAGLSDIATVTITVWGMDDPIELTAPGPQTTAEETALTFSAANGNAITVADIESPRVLVSLLGNYGTVTVQNTADVEFPYPYQNGTNYLTFYADSPAEANAALEGVVFTPELHFNGTAHLSVLIQDMDSQTYYPAEDWAAIAITVTGVNDPPLAQNDYYELAEDLPLVVSGIGVLQNDYDLEWTWLAGGGGSIPLTAVLVDGPAHGSVTLNSNGSFTYTPNANFFGTDSFTYRAADESSLSNLATVTLTIWSMNDPIAVDVPDAQTIAEDTSITFSAANGNALTISDIESPRIIVALLVQDGILTLPSTAGLEFPYAESTNNSPSITFYADNPAEANAALEGLVFTPNANFNGQVYLTLFVQDTTFAFPPAEAFGYTQITVTPVNDAPVAVNDSYAAESGVPFWATLGGGGSGVGVLMNDQDVDWDLLTATLVSGPAHGTLEFNSDGTFTYTADSAYTGTDSFTYRAFDGQVESGLATATFTVTRNDPPVSVGDAYSVNEDGSLSVPGLGVLGNDSDPNGGALTAHLVSGPAHGTLTLNQSGSFTYTPTANYFGPDEFWYRSFDGTHYSDPVAVNLTVNPVNDAPVATGNTYSVDEDVVLTVGASGVLGNDSDIDSATLTAALVSGPSHGVLSLGANGSFIYTPSANYFGSDSFTYRANDGQANSNVATVSITVNAVNDAPNAVNDAYTLNEDQTLTVTPLPGVFSLTMVSQPGDYIGQGQTYSTTTQTGTFTANRNFDNGVSVHYSGGGHWWHLHFAGPFNVDLATGHYANATRWPFQAANVPGLSVYGDGRGSNTLTGNFTVHQAVYAADGSVLRFAASFEQHSEGFAPALTGTINFNQGDGPGGVLVNDTDVEGSPLAISVVSGPAHGTLGMNVDGSFTYQPTANYNGVDSFTYRLSDGTSEGNLATVTLTVNAVNDFPTANHDSYTVAEDNVLTVGTPGVLANDFDVDGDSLTATLVTPPTQGSLTFNSNGSFTYTPNANYNGTDIFKYAARDASGWLSFIRTVTLTVTSVNDPPTASDDSYTTAEDTPLTVAAGGVLANDSDAEGAALSSILVNGPAHGTLSLNTDGSFTYASHANYHGADSFTYKASDGSADSDVVTVSLTVSPVNDAPTAADDSYSAAEDQALAVAAAGVLANDSDLDGEALNALLVSGPAHGTLTLNADGSFNYTAHANYNGSDSFTYKANDGSADSNVATVSLTISAVNDAPVAVAGADRQSDEGATVTFDALGSLDVDGGNLTYAWDFGDGGTASSFSVQHTYADEGTYTVTLTVSDGQTSTTDALVMTVFKVAPVATVSGPSAGVRGQTQTFTFGALDPSPVDQAADFTYSIHWGDGNTQTVTGPNSTNVDHVFAATGTYTVSVQATDKDGVLGDAVQHTITVSAVLVQNGNLQVGGTTSGDTINLKVADTSGGVRVTINGVTQGVFNPSGAIFVYAQAGIDNVKFETTKFGGQTRYIQDAAFVFGGAGNDSLDARGSSAKNVIVGDAGNDTIWGGTGRDILIGGLGTDTLRGGGDDDLLIGNGTTYDANLNALTALMAEWSRTNASYSVRAGHLLGDTGGLNDGYLLDSNAILNDSALDQLYGEGGIDLFFSGFTGPADSANDDGGGEMTIGL